jgi:Ni/Co efflux regulator RcnB
MRKLAYVVAAISAIAIAAPSIASAETVVIKHRDHLHRDWHHAWNRDRGFRDHGWHHHDRAVIIKNHRHEG